MRLASLGSGSRGNATLIAAGTDCVMIDCGFSVTDARQRAARLGADLAHLRAILVTHEHSDHASGVAALSRHYGIPVYATHGTAASGRLDGCAELRAFNADSRFAIGDLEVHAVAVPHDAREPVQYRLGWGACGVGILTDLGSITPHVSAAFSACDLLLLEFNHDREMLAGGPYPPALKRRVGGAWGHLSNEEAARFLAEAGVERLERLFIAHISEKNNRREQVLRALAAHCPEVLPRLTWAHQDTGFPWYELGAQEMPVMPARSSRAPTGAVG